MPSRKATKKLRKSRKLRKTRGRRRTQRGGEALVEYARGVCDEIKNAKDIKSVRTLYLPASKKVHPDKGGSKEAFQVLQDCYEKKEKSLEVPQPADAAPPPAPAQQPSSAPSSGPQPILRRSNLFSYIELTIPKDIWEKIWDTSTHQVKQSIRDRLKKKYETSYDASDYNRSPRYTHFNLKSGGEVKVLPLDGEGRVFILVLNTENLHPDIRVKWSKEVREMYGQLVDVSREETS